MRFVHLLLFRCPDCNLPVAVARITDERNLEGIDAETIEMNCSYCADHLYYTLWVNRSQPVNAYNMPTPRDKSGEALVEKNPAQRNS
jgi:hypothetical protein